MRFVLKYKFELGVIFLLAIVYFILRLPNLTVQPIFADEAIYVRWAQVMKSEPTLRFLPLSDGKTPLFMWVLMPIFKVISDPLFAGRFLSVITGFGTFLGVIFLGWKFFSPRVGILAAFLITITPYMVFFDRMALVDSMFAFLSLWSLIFGLWLVKTPRLDLSMITGFVIGASILTKTPGMFNIIGLPITLLTLKWGQGSIKNGLLKAAFFVGLSMVIALGIYNLLRLGPGFVSLSSRNQDYIFPISRIWEYPLDPLVPHIHDLANWFPVLLTWPIIFLVFGGIIISILYKSKYALTILLWALFPLIVQMFLLKTFTARYILFSIPPLLFLGGFFLDYLINLRFKLNTLKNIVLVLVIIVFCLNFNLKLLFDNLNVPLPRNEKEGYFEEWTAGYGFSEIATELSERAKNEQIVVGTEGSFGTLPDGLYIYLDKTPNIAIIGGTATISAALKESTKKHPTFFIANKSRFPWIDTEGLKLIRVYPKAKGPVKEQNAILFFELDKSKFMDFPKPI